MAYRLIQGDCREVLKTLPDQSVNCIVTSPPYYGLRDYKVDGQLGLEQTPEVYVSNLVSVFAEARRALRDDGTLWLNLGDSYYHINPSGSQGQTGQWATRTFTARGAGGQKYIEGLKPKDLIGIPWRVAFALQADGWWLRQDIIWHKPNPMPESVTDRCTKAHEYLFLLSKSARYYFDHKAIMEQASTPLNDPRIKRTKKNGEGAVEQKQRGVNGQCGSPMPGLRNKRSVWTVSTRAYRGSHFAVFPPNLIEPCILAGCPEGGTILDPFGGAGTVALVANKHNRNSISIELNADYIKLAEERLT